MGRPIKYSQISQNYQSRFIKNTIESLEKVGVLVKVKASSPKGLPLITYASDKKFKLIYLDVGLLQRSSRIDIKTLIQEKDLIFLNRGSIAEQFVGQELLAYQSPYEEGEIYFWHRDKTGSQAEIDYMVQYNGVIVPIEVKSGVTGNLKSLKIFLEENKKSCPLGLRISQKEFGYKDNILSIPFYLISQIERLIQESY